MADYLITQNMNVFQNYSPRRSYFGPEIDPFWMLFFSVKISFDFGLKLQTQVPQSIITMKKKLILLKLIYRISKFSFYNFESKTLISYFAEVWRTSIHIIKVYWNDHLVDCFSLMHRSGINTNLFLQHFFVQTFYYFS